MTHVVSNRQLEGCQAITKSGYSFLLKYDECNFCTIKTLQEMFGTCKVVEDPDGGVWAVVRNEPYVWFDTTPTHCTCKLQEN